MTPGDGWVCGHLWMKRCDPPTGCAIHSCERHDMHKVAHRCSCGATKPLEPEPASQQEGT